MYRIKEVLAVTTLLFSSNLIAQGVAEDFSFNPLLIEINQDNLGSAEDGISPGIDGTSLVLRASTNNDERAKIWLSPYDSNEITEVTVTASLSSETEFDAAVDGKVSINMEAYLYNDIQENGLGDEERTGDSRVSMSMAQLENGDSYFNVCFDRRNSDGSKSVQPGADINNGDKCTNFELRPEFDTTYTMTVGYDQSAALVYGDINGERVEFPVTTGHFTAQRPYSEFVLRVEGTSTVGIANVYSAASNGFELENLAAYAEPQRYRFPNREQDVEIRDGKLRMAIKNDENSRITNRGFPVVVGETDYVEAVMMLSSESVIPGNGYGSARLRNYFYNETQDGGIGDDGLGIQTSNVFASINLFVSADYSVAADVSVFRADNGNWSELTKLSNDPEDPHPVLMDGLSLDTEYLAFIRLDKEAKQIVFNFEGEEHIYNIQTPIYQSSFTTGAGLDVRVSGVGETVAYFDNFRSHPDVLTVEELVALVNEETNSETVSNTDAVEESLYEGSACIDTDGDGWGWQKPADAPGRSCVVSESTAEETSRAICPDDSYFTVVGDDGKRYGWYLNASCVFNDIAGAASGEVALTHPACPDDSYFTVVGDDGTSYGWYNNQTCIVGSTLEEDSANSDLQCVDPNSSNTPWNDNCQLSIDSAYRVSAYVQGVQRILHCQGYGGNTSFEAYADGILGPATEQSIRNFQTDSGLVVDGIVNSETWDALESKLSVIGFASLTVDNQTYDAYGVQGCEESVAHFYHNASGINATFVWKMAATPGSTILVEFSNDFPITL